MHKDIKILNYLSKIEKLYAEKLGIEVKQLDYKINYNDNELSVSWSRKFDNN